MKPDFALDFRDNQIALLHRQEGGWAAIGRVAMDDPDLDAAMSYLRATALGLSPRGISTKLILPNNAILYTTLPDLPYDAAKRSAQIAADLTGRTPYAVADLVWDWTDAGASAEVAVIARETLDEAEAFAAQHRFNPISFAAIPNSGNFEGEVWFGASALSQTLLAQGEVVQRDEVFAFAPPVEDAPKAALSASDFEMGDDENGSPVDAADADAPPPRDETDVAQDTGDQVPVAQDMGAQDMGAQDLGAHGTAEIAEIEDGTASTQQSPDLAADLAEADFGADGPVVDDGREVWQDFVASNDSAPQIQAEPAQSDILAAQDTDPPPAPASFDAAMAELPEENDNQGIADPEEAPMAEDVPLMDAPGEELQAADLAAGQLDPTVDETANELGSTPTPELGEKRPSKAEQMIAAFSARRAAAMAQVEAASNSARVEPISEASAAPAIEVIDVALADGADMGPITAPIQDPLIANAETSAPVPKLGGASASAGKAPEIVHQSGLKPAAIQHIPAKDLPKKPQNLTAMPKARSAKRAIGMGWVLTAALLIALVAAAALSTYVLETVSAFFERSTQIVSVEPGQPTPDQPVVAPPASLPQPQGVRSPEEAAPSLPQPAADGPELLASVQAGVDAPVAATLPKAAPLDLPAAQPSAPILPPLAVAPAAPTSAEPALADQVQPVAVVTGRPALTPAPRPAAILAAAAVAAPVEIAAKTAAKTSDASSVFADPALANARPLPRPRSNAQPSENAVAAPFADPALANARPLPRPAGILAAGREARLASAPASLLTSAEISAAENALTAPAPTAAASPLALNVSRIPAARPKGLKAAFEASRDAQIVAAAAASAAPEPATQQPPEVAASNNNAPAAVEADSEPEVTSAAGRAGSRSVVAKQATIKNAINLNNVNLVGVFGSQSNRYALIRQPSGTFKKLKVGDRFDGGKVAAITESEVRYAKGGEMLALTMPKT